MGNIRLDWFRWYDSWMSCIWFGHYNQWHVVWSWKRESWRYIGNHDSLPASASLGYVKCQNYFCHCHNLCIHHHDHHHIHFVVYCEQYKATRTAFLQDITDKTDTVVKGSETEILRAILQKEALSITGITLRKCILRGRQPYLIISMKRVRMRRRKAVEMRKRRMNNLYMYMSCCLVSGEGCAHRRIYMMYPYKIWYTP